MIRNVVSWPYCDTFLGRKSQIDVQKEQQSAVYQQQCRRPPLVKVPEQNEQYLYWDLHVSISWLVYFDSWIASQLRVTLSGRKR